MSQEQEYIEVYTESTPNPLGLKFVTSRMLLPNRSVDFRAVEDAKGKSAMAEALFGLPFVTGVFIMNNFVTLNRGEEYEWYEITPEIKDFIRKYLESCKEVVSDTLVEEQKQAEQRPADIQIQELLDKYVKPAVEMDGGHIAFKSFQDGIVTLELQGACSGCPSSMVTLKGGIEGLLKRMVPDVKEVVAYEG